MVLWRLRVSDRIMSMKLESEWGICIYAMLPDWMAVLPVTKTAVPIR